MEREEEDEDLLERLQEEQWEMMRRRGCSEEEVEAAKRRKLYWEEVNVCRLMLRSRAWTFDISCSFVHTHLRLAAALEGLGRRGEALETLQRAVTTCRARSSSLVLALAKLLFKDDQKSYSLELCDTLARRYRALKSGEVHPCSDDDDDKSESGSDCESECDYANEDKDSQLLEENVAQAYYLAGWTYIHDDNHTAAYRTWSEGHFAVPTCPLLSRQHKKRECWDENFSLPELLSKVRELVGEGSYGEGSIHKDDFDAFKLMEAPPPEGTAENIASLHNDPPAVSLYDENLQRRELVFRSRKALLLPVECNRIIDVVERYHNEKMNGKWSTVRDSSVKTTDVAVEDIPILRLWLLYLLHSRIYPIIDVLFPLLGDGTTIAHKNKDISETSKRSRMRVHDAFIVRYDAENEKSFSLPEHCDTSAVSVVLALNSVEDSDYEGGGTWFEALAEKGSVVNADIGKAVFFAGPLKHAGYPITKGVRNILVLFLYIEDFHYGPLIQNYISNHHETPKDGIFSRTNNQKSEKECVDNSENNLCIQVDNGSPIILNSGGEERGYVVYRQTVELVNMLESSNISNGEEFSF